MTILHGKSLREGVLALLFLLLFVLGGCSEKVYTPVLPDAFRCNAVYAFGDFVFHCRIVKTPQEVSVSVTDTRAKGLLLKNDGETLTLTRSELSQSYTPEAVAATNPARLLYEALFHLDSATATAKGERFVFSGMTQAGRYELTVSRSGEPLLLTVSDADIKIVFENL